MNIEHLSYNVDVLREGYSANPPVETCNLTVIYRGKLFASLLAASCFQLLAVCKTFTRILCTVLEMSTLGLHCQIFHFMVQKYFVLVKGQDVISTPRFFDCKAMLLKIDAICGLTSSWWKRHSVDVRICCFKTKVKITNILSEVIKHQFQHRICFFF